MESKQKISQPLVLIGLLLLVFLSFETLRGTTINVEKVMPIDSTYIVALIDIGLISIGMVLGSSRQFEKHKGRVGIDILKAVFMLPVFLWASYMILSSMAIVQWNDVLWFEPKLNFDLIAENFENSLFVSQLLILVLVFIFAFQGYEPKSETDESDRVSKV